MVSKTSRKACWRNCNRGLSAPAPLGGRRRFQPADQGVLGGGARPQGDLPRFEAPTVAELATCLDAAQPRAEHLPGPPLEPLSTGPSAP